MNSTTNPILKQMETIAKPKDKRKFPFLTIVPSSNVDLIRTNNNGIYVLYNHKSTTKGVFT